MTLQSAAQKRTINKHAAHDIVTANDACAFNEDYELVEGVLIFKLWYHEYMLVVQKFIAFEPGQTSTQALKLLHE